MHNEKTLRLVLISVFCGLASLAGCTHQTNTSAPAASNQLGSTINTASPTPVPTLATERRVPPLFLAARAQATAPSHARLGRKAVKVVASDSATLRPRIMPPLLLKAPRTSAQVVGSDLAELRPRATPR